MYNALLIKKKKNKVTLKKNKKIKSVQKVKKIINIFTLNSRIYFLMSHDSWLAIKMQMFNRFMFKLRELYQRYIDNANDDDDDI